MDPISESEELRVSFYPELFLQRRVWVLNILRREGITQVLDVGCGEGELLSTLCQPAPWLAPPPIEVLSPVIENTPTQTAPDSPVFNDEDIPNLHITSLHGLDVSAADLDFAIKAATPINLDARDVDELLQDRITPYMPYSNGIQRWEELRAKVWKGGLETINEEFVGIECISAMEVIEHLPPNIFPAFAPMLLGVYHPEFLLITTPSYTFNARFTAPDAPPSARKGFPDPTGRTDRIFRHDDHKFEWTREEFTAWCNETAAEWGYKVVETSIGRAMTLDPWGRDDELRGASSVAMFRRLPTTDNKLLEEKGRAAIAGLALTHAPHEVLADHLHPAHPASTKPRTLEDIAVRIKAKMESYREVFMRVEELWFEKEIAAVCGGWIELMVRAVEQCPDLCLKREGGSKRRDSWSIELVAGVGHLPLLADGNTSVDCIPPGWIPGEALPDSDEEDEDSEFEETNAEDGDVSAQTSDADVEEASDDEITVHDKRPYPWETVSKDNGKKPEHAWARASTETGGWADYDSSEDAARWGGGGHKSTWSSAAGWEGDDDTTS
ncbi:hypothetical protein D9619_004099 [Psilocybe cf. subviscida]|uniref:Small RNA 2'-O-methyltransferase n=1 Tax=Psilocybe cf. subviscida TaxID=2480587 RepID=A0A8H5F820_9AGAR|nr:hypothetical protein D9619_004099 [Psilocybe cf. subviscida]